MRTQTATRRAVATAAAFGALAFALAAAPAPASAALEFDVDSTKDGVDADGGDDVCATAKGKCTLRAAIDQANATIGSDIIKLPTGIFKLTRPAAGGVAAPNAEGDLFVDDPVLIEGSGAGRTTIKQTVEDRVIEARVDSLSALQLEKLKVAGGHITEPGNQFGGGIFNEGVLTLDRVTVAGNKVTPAPGANSFGGGIFQQDGILIITASKVTNNLVRYHSQTGAAVGGGVMTIDGGLGVEDSRITGNIARVLGGGTGEGGGLSVRGPSQVTNTVVSGNQAAEGGGIQTSSSANDGSLTLENTTVSGNDARRGGGIFLFADATNTITNATISGNTAPKGGAAIYSILGDVDATDVTIFDNRAKRRRGSIQIAGTTPSVSLTHSIVSGRGEDCRGDAAQIHSDAQNVLGDPTCAEAGSTGDLVANPRLKDLSTNPGPSPGFVTKTHALKGSSPAIDFVTSGCPPPATDQRGVARPQGAACDAGSFEREP